jgi:hypothetical protein
MQAEGRTGTGGKAAGAPAPGFGPPTQAASGWSLPPTRLPGSDPAVARLATM